MESSFEWEPYRAPENEDEPVVECRFEYKGYVFVVLFQPRGFRCGYVRLTEKDPYYKMEYDSDQNDISCHWGINYSREYLFGQTDENAWWIGFDCIHAGDKKDYKNAKRYYFDFPQRFHIICVDEVLDNRYPIAGEVARSMDYVMQECITVIEQVIRKRDQNGNEVQDHTA